MSIPQSISITCPECNATYTTQIFRSVNTDLRKDLAEQIISGDFFSVQCPKCGKSNSLEYDILYHDIERKTMIWVVSKKASNYNERYNAVKNTEIPYGYSTRIVGNIDELREKVAALECGRDDRVVELTKLFMSLTCKQQNPEFNICSSFYTACNGKETVCLYDYNNKEVRVDFREEDYNTMAYHCGQQLNDFPEEQFAEYNWKWARKIIDMAAGRLVETTDTVYTRENKRYLVGIKGESYFIPPFCTCCMEPTDKTEKISYTATDLNFTSNERKRVTTTLNMPVCEKCLKHRGVLSGYLVLVCILSAVIGGAAFWFLLLEQLSGILEFIISTGVAVGAYFAISHFMKIKALDREHSSRGDSAWFYPKSVEAELREIKKEDTDPDIIFTFTNKKYAEEFIKANRGWTSDIVEQEKLNTANEINVLQASERPVLTMFKMILVFLIVALFVGCISESIKANNPMHWNTETQRWEYSYNGITSVGGREKFSQDAPAFAEVYTDIISILPEVGIYEGENTNYSGFVCKCEAAEGGTIWIYISTTEYRNNFDSTIHIYREYNRFREITFEKPERVFGKARYADSILDNLSEDIGKTMLIEFESVD